MNYKLSDTGFLFIIIANMKIKTKKNFNKGFQSIRIEGLQIMNNIHDDFLTFRCLSSIALCLLHITNTTSTPVYNTVCLTNCKN